MIRNVMDHEFDTYVNDNNKRFILVDFWAEWCNPCKMMTPELEQLAVTHSQVLNILKVNVDDNERLALAFGVKSIPTLIIFSGGKEIKRLLGFVPHNVLLNEISKL